MAELPCSDVEFVLWFVSQAQLKKLFKQQGMQVQGSDSDDDSEDDGHPLIAAALRAAPPRPQQLPTCSASCPPICDNKNKKKSGTHRRLLFPAPPPPPLDANFVPIQTPAALLLARHGRIEHLPFASACWTPGVA